jgi:Dyp-type peroxidase family
VAAACAWRANGYTFLEGDMAVQELAEDSRTSIKLRSIQGDIVVGLQKDVEKFIFFTIKDLRKFKRAVKSIQPLVTSAETAADREAKIAFAKKAGSSVRFAFLGLNIGFTYSGLEKLLGQADFGAAVPGFDASFRAGAEARAPALFDDLAHWKPAFRGGAIDGVLLIAGPDDQLVQNFATALVRSFGKAISIAYDEMGKTRPQRGHEHFGFLDGVSQPGIRGFTTPENPVDKEQGLPGQDLIHPGEFVFGYPQQVDPFKVNRTATKEEVGPIAQPPLPWMENGSLMVFRRLEQKVLAFQENVAQTAALLEMDPALLAARMVGRWQSGASLVQAPLQDDIGLGSNKFLNNDFEFGGDHFQRRCPYAAHIRKTYPRDDLNDAGHPLLAGESGEASVQTHRIRRAGIPFGPEIGPEDQIGAEVSRGLMFVCYQTSIEEQFEFIQMRWSNDVNFVVGKQRPPGSGGGPVTPGQDPIIGLSGGGLTMDEAIPNYPTGNTRSTISIAQPFVTATGAAYFFMPSLDALRDSPIVN